MQITVSLKFDLTATAPLSDLQTQMQEAGRQAMRTAFFTALRAIEEQQRACPQCGSQQVRTEGTDRRVLRTLFGRVVLAPRRLRCQDCRRRFRPAEGCLASVEGKQVTPALAQAAAQAGAAWPSATAAREVARLWGASISPEQIPQLTSQAGTQEARRQIQAAAALVEPTAAKLRAEGDHERLCPPSATPPALLVVGLAGGWVKSPEPQVLSPTVFEGQRWLSGGEGLNSVPLIL